MTDRDPHDRSVPDSWKTQLGRFDRSVTGNPACSAKGCMHLAQRDFAAWLTKHYCPIHSDMEETK